MSALLGLALVPLAIVATVAYETSRDILTDNANAKLEELAAQTMDKIDRVVFTRSQDMQAWVTMEAFQDAIADDPDGRITLTLVRLWSQYGHQTSIYCLNQLGQIVASNEVSLIGRSVARTPWFRQGTQANGLAITDLGYDDLTHTLALRLMVPITASHDDQMPIGYLVAHIPYGELQDILQQVKVREGGQSRAGHVIVVNGRGGVIAGPAFLVDATPNPDFPSATMDHIGYVPEDRRPLSARGAFLTADARMLVGFARSSGYRTYKGLGWATLVAQDTSEAFGPITMLRREFLGLFLATTVLVLVVAYGLSRSISIPIQSLTALANRIAAGDLSQTIAVDSQDEVGALATSFNRMTEDLRRSRDELIRTNHELTIARDHALQASRLKSHFLANMSHEIRTPMNGILGMTELMLATNLSERQRRLADTVDRSGRALLQIINDILDFSKIEAGKLELERVAFDVRRVVEEAVDVFSEQAQRKGLALSWTIDDDVPTVLQGDPGRIRQILINLVGNGLKFTERGEVGIRVDLVDREPAQVALQWTVSDTGIGIPAEAQRQIFEAFSQADSSMTRKYGGTGLGLSIVKQLVTLMHGTIEVRSDPGHGSQFTFTTRLEQPQDETAGTSEHAAASASRASTANRPPDPDMRSDSPPAPTTLQPQARVLVVEDNLVNQEVARLMLEQLGHTPVVAMNGREAMEALDHASYDIIFMDCQMPEMDGFATTRAIRDREAQHAELPRTPIIALTAHAIQGDDQACLAAGMDDYLSKPFTQAQLAAKLARWLAPWTASASLPDQATTSPEAAPNLEGSGPSIGRSTAMESLVPLPQTSAADPGGHGLVDQKVWKDIAALQQPGRPDVLVTMLSMFLKDSDQVIEGLRQAVHRGDANVVFELSHALKSRSGVLGAMRLADLCRQLEHTGRNGDLTAAPGQFDRLWNEFIAVTQRFRHELSRRSAA